MTGPVRSYSSLFAGIGCGLGTIIVLYGHVRSIEDLGLIHLWIAIGLLAAILGGYNMNEDFSTKQWVRGIGFGLLFVVGTFISVGLSSSRSAVIMETHEKAYKDAIHKRKEQEDVIAEAQRRMKGAKEEYDKAKSEADTWRATFQEECGSGKGTKCDGKKVSKDAAIENETAKWNIYNPFLQKYDAEVKNLNDMVRPSPPNPEVRQFARIYATVRGISEEDAMEVMKYLFPFCIALISEFGTIMFSHKAFGPAPPKKPAMPDKTIGQIAQEAGLSPSAARKVLRAHKEPRPAQGWVFAAKDADRIKQILIASQANTTLQ